MKALLGWALGVLLGASVALVPTDAEAKRRCCKYCSERSQPCGDSCISLSKICRKGPGCACSR
jgi:hypothetical protein